MKVAIYELGRNWRSFTVEIPTAKGTTADDIAEELESAVCTSGALRSKEISVIWDSNSGTGTIYVGFGRPVGKARVIK